MSGGFTMQNQSRRSASFDRPSIRLVDLLLNTFYRVQTNHMFLVRTRYRGCSLCILFMSDCGWFRSGGFPCAQL